MSAELWSIIAIGFAALWAAEWFEKLALRRSLRRAEAAHRFDASRLERCAGMCTTLAECTSTTNRAEQATHTAHEDTAGGDNPT